MRKANKLLGKRRGNRASEVKEARTERGCGTSNHGHKVEIL